MKKHAGLTQEEASGCAFVLLLAGFFYLLGAGTVILIVWICLK